MLKLRYLLIHVIVSFLLIFGVSWVLELYAVKYEAEQATTIVSLAAESALQGGQGIDDFFVNTTSSYSPSNPVFSINDYEMADANPLRIYAQDRLEDKAYTLYDNLFQWYDKTADFIDGVDDKEDIFGVLYGSSYLDRNADFIDWARNTFDLYIQIPVIPTSGSVNVLWVKVPKISLMGAYLFWGSESEYVSDLLNSGVYDDNDINYGWKALQQNNYMGTKKTGYFGDYYLSPSKLGLTYVNIDLVENLYRNNLDLLMRAKYTSTEAGSDITQGNGLVGSQYLPQSDDVQANVDGVNNSALNGADVINNGVFSICKSESGIADVQYMVIDLYDDKYNDIIEQIYGAGVDVIGTDESGNTVYSDPYVITANSLRSKTTVVDATGNPAEHSYIIVAKVTFDADIILRYKTATFTVWRTSYDDSHNNYVDIIHNDGSGGDGMTDSTKYQYTTLYSVTTQ